MRFTSAFMFAIFSALALLSSCGPGIDGNGNVTTDLREQAPFSEVKIAGAFEIELREGNEHFLEVEADENLLPIIKSSVSNGVLRIENETPIRNAKSLKLKIQARKFTNVDLAGASDLRSVSTLTSKRLEVDGAGACKIDLDYTGDELMIDMSGACDVALSGKARNLNIELAGAGEVDAASMSAKFVAIEIAGAGDVSVHARKALNIEISGSGDVKYKGSPKITKSVSGAASITPIE